MYKKGSCTMKDFYSKDLLQIINNQQEEDTLNLIITALKKQIGVEISEKDLYCPICRKPVKPCYKYCSACGQKLKLLEKI